MVYFLGMKHEVLLSMLFELLQKRKVTAAYFAEKYGISERTVYRYVTVLSTHAPIEITRGRNGGVRISDAYKLPVGFFSTEEYDAPLEALETHYGERGEERFLSARRKLTQAEKTTEKEEEYLLGADTLLLLESVSGGSAAYEKLRLIERCILERIVLEMEYRDKKTTKKTRKIEPHLLVFKDGNFFVYAFCRTKKEFRLFQLGRIYKPFALDEKFNKREFDPSKIREIEEDVPTVEVRLEITGNAFSKAEELFGGEALKPRGEKWQIDLTLPDDETLPRTVISLGAGALVIKPERLKKKVKALAASILKNYL